MSEPRTMQSYVDEIANDPREIAINIRIED